MLLEIGRGSGRLLQAMFRLTTQFEAFHKALDLHLLEANTTLREVQIQRLKDYDPKHIDAIDALPDLTTIIVANELFDTLPTRQFRRTSSGWEELMIISEGGKLQLQFLSTPAVAGLKDCAEGARVA